MDTPKFDQIARRKSQALNPCLWDGLRLALYPMMGRTGRTLIDFSGYGLPTVHGGTWARANQYPALNGHGGVADVSLNRRILPITGSPRRYSIFAVVRRTNAGGEAGICRQFTTAEANRTVLAVGTNVRLSIGTDYFSTATVAVGDVVTIVITQNVGVFGQMWINGRFDRTVANNGEASDADFALDTLRDLDLMALCVWNGKSLLPPEILQLHTDPFAVLRPRFETSVGFIQAFTPSLWFDTSAILP
jgi:hypothetical protein